MTLEWNARSNFIANECYALSIVHSVRRLLDVCKQIHVCVEEFELSGKYEFKTTQLKSNISVLVAYSFGDLHSFVAEEFAELHHDFEKFHR